MKIKKLVLGVALALGSSGSFAFFEVSEDMSTEEIKSVQSEASKAAETAKTESLKAEKEAAQAKAVAEAKAEAERQARIAQEQAATEANKAKAAAEKALEELKAQMAKTQSERDTLKIEAAKAKANEAQALADIKALEQRQAKMNQMQASDDAVLARKAAERAVEQLESQVEKERAARQQAEQMFNETQALIAKKDSEIKDAKSAKAEAERLKAVAEEKAKEAQRLAAANADNAAEAQAEAERAQAAAESAERDVAAARASEAQAKAAEQAAKAEAERIKESSVQALGFSEGWSVGGFGYMGMNSDSIMGLEIKKDITTNIYLSGQAMNIAFDSADQYTDPVEDGCIAFPDGSFDCSGVELGDEIRETATGAVMINLGWQDTFGSSNFGYYANTGVGLATNPDEENLEDEFNPIDSATLFGVEAGVTYDIWSLRAKAGYKHISTIDKIGDGVDSFGFGVDYRF